MSAAPVIKKVDVAAAVITREDGSFLLGRRAPGTFYPGYWEFPGGKVEAGESPKEALVRELQEELGIRAEVVWPWIMREHAYEHAHVRLHFFEVPAWSGQLTDHVHSALAWQHIGAPIVEPMLPANGPVLKALALPRIYGVTHATDIGTAAQLSALERACAAGLKMVQIREAGLPSDVRETFVRNATAVAHSHGARLLINGDLELAARLACDGVQLPSDLLKQLTARPDFALVGASCHTRAELEHAARLGVDFAVLGAVKTTPSHPGQTGLGWARFAELTASLPMPIYAIGGLSHTDLEHARAAGAHGIAAIRGVW